MASTLKYGLAFFCRIKTPGKGQNHGYRICRTIGYPSQLPWRSFPSLCREVSDHCLFRKEQGNIDYNQGMDKILIFGPSVMDLVQHVKRLPREGEEIVPLSRNQRISGSGFCMADLFRFLNMPYHLYTSAGTGLYGEEVKDRLDRLGFSYSSKSSEVAGCMYTLMDEAGNTARFAVPGGEYDFVEEDHPESRYAILDGSYLYEADCDPLPDLFLQEHTAVLFCPHQAGVETDPVLWEAILRTGPIIHLCEEEAALLKEEDTQDLKSVAETIHLLTHQPVIILRTDGSGYYYEKGQEFIMPSAVDSLTDRTGMSEAHAAAFLLARNAGVDVRSAMRFASECAALAAKSAESVIAEADHETVRQFLIQAIMTESRGGHGNGSLS